MRQPTGAKFFVSAWNQTALPPFKRNTFFDVWGSAKGGLAMKNITFWVVIVVGLMTGTAGVVTYNPHHEEADCTGTGC